MAFLLFSLTETSFWSDLGQAHQPSGAHR